MEFFTGKQAIMPENQLKVGGEVPGFGKIVECDGCCFLIENSPNLWKVDVIPDSSNVLIQETNFK